MAMLREEWLQRRRENYTKNKIQICEIERKRREAKRPDGLKKLGRWVPPDELSAKWRQIPDHPDYYASEDGEIVGKWKRVMIGHTDKCGYVNVILRENNHNSPVRVHRLIASTYIEKPSGKDYINHKDGNKLNNNVSNLEWCTKSENTRHSFETGLQKTVNGTLLIKGERLEYVKNNINCKSDAEIANYLNCRKDTIRKLRYKIQKGEL